MGLGSIAKNAFRYTIPLGLRKQIALFIGSKPWLSKWDYMAQNILSDYQKSNPKEFHKFFWANHIGAYAKWYDSESLFDIDKMEPSRKIFFDDIKSVLKELKLDETKDIGSVLEVGCSLGYLLRFIESDIIPNAQELVGIDIDGSAIDKGIGYLSRVESKVKLVAGDMEELDRLLGKKKYDLVFAGGVLSYLNREDATAVVKEMLSRTGKMLALIGLASHTLNNSDLKDSDWSADHNNQWIHNFKQMVESAGGKVVKVRWEGAKQFNFQTIYSVYAVPAEK